VDPGFELSTDRLLLRPYRSADVEPLESMFSDPEHMRWYPAPYRHDRVVEWVENQLRGYEWNGVRFAMWIVEERSTGTFLGTAGPTKPLVEDAYEVEIGWHVRKDQWGQGIAPEAAIAAREWCWEHLEVDHLISLVRPENEPSAHVAEKIGMRVDRLAPYKGLTHCVYRIDRPA
jgi:[ribosomal protein S5]-alanine N-acetyltransferase